MSKQDYYETLGVSRDADEKALKSAFRKLAMQYHPDRNPGDEVAERKFKELGEAYDVLKDPERRAAYDRYGHAAFEQGMGGGQGGAGFDGSAFSDIFDDLFGEFMGRGGGGGRGGRSSARRGNDLRYDIEISLEDAYNGVSQEISLTTSVSCEVCDGTGAKEGSKPQTCQTCGGVGKVRTNQGFFMVERTCPTCGGAGQVIADPCGACAGTGVVQREKTLQVKVPKGVETGTRIRLAGEGQAGVRGGPAGDLYLFVTVAPHSVFERDREMILCQVPLPLSVAALGGEIEVPTIEGGRAKVKIPPGTQSGKQFRMRGKGMPTISGGPLGDMIVRAQVETPVNLTARQRELLEEFGEIERSEAGKSSPQSDGFFSRVKELWDDLTE
ncbi:MAG: molecular chaperone DnaJ [Pseudomonadota bacterium]